ncbi:pirin family protein [Maritalea myrionectae]|uniref:pirin family protein n=1 Tax=Maritalea myrionectae TaxID=454601 RepID=UPI0004254F00|nr:pirin family protein [Maritalea myrionectae]
MTSNLKYAAQTSRGHYVQEGEGIMVHRYIGTPDIDVINPFLMLDWFKVESPKGPIPGFPPHPHRGFETITLMLSGNMGHRDNIGNVAEVGPGGVQWMKAAGGIIHSEMPRVDGDEDLSGLQFWLNLPAAQKGDTPEYTNLDVSKLEVEKRDKANMRVIAGETSQGTKGHFLDRATRPFILDVSLQAGGQLAEPLEGRQGFLLVVEGTISMKDGSGDNALFGEGSLIELSTSGDAIDVVSDSGGRFVLATGEALNEPIAKGGPFVMNTKSEIYHAFQDFSAGKFGPALE